MICAECPRRERDWAWTDRGKYNMGWTCKDDYTPDECPMNEEEQCTDTE